MNRRRNLEGGGWFDVDKARHWEEATFWNGNNRVSLATGDQFEHEALYRSARGAWILHSWSAVARLTRDVPANRS